jgi:hypothetical protein
METPWRAKANKVIAALCKESYERCNRLPNGRLRKKQLPYSVPEVAKQFTNCLGKNDEIGAKRLFLYDYEIEQTIKQETKES